MTATTLPVDVGTVPQWTLSDRLRKARETAALSQTELADEIGVSRRSVTNYEVGSKTPGRPVMLAWALRCGVPLTWLEQGDDPGSGGDAPGHVTTPAALDGGVQSTLGTAEILTFLRPLDRRRPVEPYLAAVS